MTTPLAPFVAHLGATRRRDGSYRAACPFCKRGPSRVLFFRLNARGYACTACHAKGSLTTLAIYVVCPETPQDGL